MLSAINITELRHYGSDLLWENNVLVIEKNFWNSRLKAENSQEFKKPSFCSMETFPSFDIYLLESSVFERIILN